MPGIATATPPVIKVPHNACQNPSRARYRSNARISAEGGGGGDIGSYHIDMLRLIEHMSEHLRRGAFHCRNRFNQRSADQPQRNRQFAPALCMRQVPASPTGLLFIAYRASREERAAGDLNGSLVRGTGRYGAAQWQPPGTVSHNFRFGSRPDRQSVKNSAFFAETAWCKNLVFCTNRNVCKESIPTIEGPLARFEANAVSIRLGLIRPINHAPNGASRNGFDRPAMASNGTEQAATRGMAERRGLGQRLVGICR